VKFREQTQKQNENMSIIRDQYNKLQTIYKRKMEQMKEKLEKDSTKFEQL
jgi:DNA-binding transcriptional regulator/RsmH inhibitor MraZ